MVYHGKPWYIIPVYTMVLPWLHYGIAEELIHLKYTITVNTTSAHRRWLWQTTKTGRRWGQCSIYRHPVVLVLTSVRPIFNLVDFDFLTHRYVYSERTFWKMRNTSQLYVEMSSMLQSETLSLSGSTSSSCMALSKVTNVSVLVPGV